MKVEIKTEQIKRLLTTPLNQLTAEEQNLLINFPVQFGTKDAELVVTSFQKYLEDFVRPQQVFKQLR